MLKKLALGIQQRAWLIVIGFLVLTVAAGIYGSGVFAHLNDDEGFEASGTQSAAVIDALKNDFPNTQAGAVIMFTSQDGQTVDTAAARAEVERILAALRPDTTLLATYYSTGRPAFLAKDKTQTYAAVTVKGSDAEQYQRLMDFMSSAHSDQLKVEVGGQLVAQRQANSQVKHDLETAELITLPLLAILLVFVFRGVVGAAMPLMLGVVSIVGALAVVRLLTNVTSIDQYAVNIITVLGLGLSVDYSLLMVSRFREELKRQTDVAAAINRTVATSGRTILFSGLTVIICLLSLSIFPVGFLRSISLGGVAALIVAIVVALTLMPAALRLLGHRINAWGFGTKPAVEGPTFWGRVNAVTSRFPLLTIAGAVVVILMLATPFRHAHYLAFDYRSLPVGSSARSVAEALTNNFGGTEDASAAVLYRPNDNSAPSAVSDLRERLAHDSRVTLVEPAVASNDGKTYKLAAHYREDDSGVAGRDLVKAIRAYDDSQGGIQVGGGAAQVADTLDVIAKYAPRAAGVIVVAMGLLLTLMLRSLLIPLQAIVLSGFGLLASFGILVLIFQEGHLTHGSWLAQTGGLSPTILLLIFTIAFGLSMDYATFLYSRIREEYDRSGHTKESIHAGVERTGYVITAAAVLMFVVVAAFASSKIPMLQQVGLGLAIAVIVDAFIVRILLVPSVMQLLGRANWYAPKWLARRRIRHE